MKINLAKAAPIIFSGLAILGLGSTIYFTAKCHEKALPEIVKIKKDNESNEPVKKRDIIKATWKYYIPVIISAGATATFIILSNAISAKQLAIMTATASTAVSQKNKIIAKTKEIVGQDKWEEISKSIGSSTANDIKDMPHKDEEVIFYDTFTNEAFYSDKATVDEACYRINRILALEGKASLADFYELLHKDAPWYAIDYGWSIEQGLEEGRYVWIDVDVIKETKSNDDDLYYRIEYVNEPTTSYELEGYKIDDSSAFERAYQEQYIAC